MDRMRAAVVAGLLAVSSVAAGTGASARSSIPVSPNRLTLTAATQHLTSSTGKALRVSIAATQGVLTVRVARRGAPETHTWTFALPQNDFGYDDDGTGLLRTGTSMRPFGALSLSIAATGRAATVGCGRARALVAPVKVTGVLRFVTRSTGSQRWGQVTTAPTRVFTGHSTMATAIPADKLCPSFLPPCVTSASWEAHNIATDLRGYEQFIGTAITVNGVSTSTLTATRLTYLPSPANATRTDVTTVDVPRPAFTFSGADARVRVPASSPTPTGSAHLASTSGDPMPLLACGAAGPNGPRTMRTEWLATYRNGAHPLTVPQQIEGAFRLHNVAGESNRANATIDRVITTTGP
jgi:hypothetical protein